MYTPVHRLVRAFTLVELLVVVVVIAVLAAILLPVFSGARKRSLQAVCLSNEKQIALSILEYSQDFDDRCPRYYAGDVVTPGSRTPGVTGPGGPPWQYWPELVSPYVQGQTSHNFNMASKVFVCPVAPYNASVISFHNKSNCSSYGLTDNWVDWYCPNDCSNGTGQSRSFAEAVAPVHTVLLAETLVQHDISYPGLSLALTPVDGGNVGYYYTPCGSAATNPPFSPSRMFLNLSWRHQSIKPDWCAPPPSDARINVAYADGHVAAKSVAQLSDFRQWSVLQGAGDVGYLRNVDGTWGHWFP